MKHNYMIIGPMQQHLQKFQKVMQINVKEDKLGLEHLA